MLKKIYSYFTKIKKAFFNIFHFIFKKGNMPNDDIRITYSGVHVSKNASYNLSLLVVSNRSDSSSNILNKVFTSKEILSAKNDLKIIVKNSFFLIMTTVFVKNEENNFITFTIPNVRNIKIKDLNPEMETIKKLLLKKLDHYKAYDLKTITFKVFVFQ
jgi:hypothetical protein